MSDGYNLDKGFTTGLHWPATLIPANVRLKLTGWMLRLRHRFMNFSLNRTMELMPESHSVIQEKVVSLGSFTMHKYRFYKRFKKSPLISRSRLKREIARTRQQASRLSAHIGGIQRQRIQLLSRILQLECHLEQEQQQALAAMDDAYDKGNPWEADRILEASYYATEPVRQTIERLKSQLIQLEESHQWRSLLMKRNQVEAYLRALELSLGQRRNLSS